jgi:transposase
MVKAPTSEEEDRRRVCRERKVLIGERVRHVNRVKGLLFTQGISGYEPLRRDRLDTLKAQVLRKLDRLELLLKQIKAVETVDFFIHVRLNHPVDPNLPICG